jgi:excisionase family DNA binding protein
MNQTESEGLLTAHEVAEMLGVRASTVYERACRGDIPVVRLWQGRRKALLRFRLSDIQEFIATRSVPAKGAGCGGKQDR